MCNGWILATAAQSAAFMYGFRALYTWALPKLQPFFGGNDVALFSALMICTHLGQVLVQNLIMLAVYRAEHPFFEQYKVKKASPWPWKSPNQATRERFSKLLRRTLWTVPANILLIALPAIVLTYWARPDGAFSMALEDMPSMWELTWQIGFCCVVEDAMFYWTHRFLHWDAIYPFIHKQHHAYSLDFTISLSSEFAHPLEYLVGNLLPVAMGPTILRCHTLTFVLWVFVRIAESIDAHSGYSFPWAISRLTPFASAPEAHEYHHSQTKGHYSSHFWFWDWFLGTEVDLKQYIDKAAIPKKQLSDGTGNSAVKPEPKKAN